ncbi:hypothetical protein CRUP_009907 [Coryphaenoides rupestris]|nr:hypothetical protein CRUP_009907 [Coryphaenoides rupestris]
MFLSRLTRCGLAGQVLRGAAARPLGSLSCCRRPGLRLSPAGPAAMQSCGQHTTTMAAPLPVTSCRVSAVKALHQERLVEVVWEDGDRSLYPYTWLRDNCQCPVCTLPSAKARSLLFSQLDIHTGVDTVQVNNNNQVSVGVPISTVSEFELARIYWDSELRIPTADFEEVLGDDKAALAWLLALRRVGMVYLRGAPTCEGQVARLSKRVGYLRLTFYGPTWRVQDKAMAVNVAYTSGDLSLHTDYPALHRPPGAQQGGQSTVVDGFRAAEVLRAEDPRAFQTLTSLRADFTDHGTDYCDFMVHLDCEGQVNRINFNNATRDSVLDMPLHQVQEFYRALKAYVDIMNRPENVVTYHMEPGLSYTSSGDKQRLLEGAYLDWDEVMSRLRLLLQAVGGEDEQ